MRVSRDSRIKRPHFRNFLIILILIISLFYLKLAVFSNNWNKKSRFTVLVSDLYPSQRDKTRVAFFSYEPSISQLEYTILPRTTHLDVPYGYQSYDASIVYELGNLDAKRGGGKLLLRSLENTFGIAFDRYYIFKNNLWDDLPENKTQLISFKQKYFSVWGIFKSIAVMIKAYPDIDSNLSFFDKLNLWTSLRQLRSDQIIFLDLAENLILEDKKLPDQNSIKIINKDLLDNFFKDQFLDSGIRSENTSIEIINATGQEKVAAQFGRIITALGGNVIIKSTAVDREIFNCRIIISNKSDEKSFLLSKLVSLYSCKISYEKENTGQADIKIILGKEFIK